MVLTHQGKEPAGGKCPGKVFGVETLFQVSLMTTMKTAKHFEIMSFNKHIKKMVKDLQYICLKKSINIAEVTLMY